ncbi:AzlC family ABC transporter permease [Rhabdaerophilum calidifontis]|uniref:AzlC family ABC transporter permease n=1 Tax=Rhabdaerophilum calidifontis TaxID=2604328 RepID=UPI001409140A|nr:AzlC family ABC transporter permease [Rhabdaerophilum calidifontis]
MLMCSLVGVGGLCRDIGYPPGAAVLSTLMIWAAPAQMVLFGSIAAGVALPAIAAAVSLSSIRFVPMCMSILPLVRRPGTPTWLLLLIAHFVAVTAWVEGMRRLPDMPQHARIPYYLGFANTVMLAAAFATGAGYFLIAELPPPLAAGLLFTSPVFFTLSLMAGARRALDWLAIGLGFAAAPLAARLVPAGLDLLVGGLGAGTLAYLAHRLRARGGGRPA